MDEPNKVPLLLTDDVNLCNFCTYIKRSDAVFRWYLDFSSLRTDESISFPFAKSIFPI